ncbi:MAG: peptidylprolyl isomerase [Oscillospiraceae bacterium]
MKRKIIAFLLALSVLFSLSSCKKTPDLEVSETVDQLARPNSGDVVAVFDTSEGIIKAVLFPKYAPAAVSNFKKHVKNGYYDGVIFHRVIEDFVIQSGDPTRTGKGGESASKLPFANEYSNEAHHYLGALCMANAQTDQNKSQFYFVAGGTVSEELAAQMEAAGYSADCIAAYKKNGGQPTLDFRYTVFGQVYEGLDIVDSISKKGTDKYSRPLTDVTIKKITIEVYEKK